MDYNQQLEKLDHLTQAGQYTGAAKHAALMHRMLHFQLMNNLKEQREQLMKLRALTKIKQNLK